MHGNIGSTFTLLRTKMVAQKQICMDKQELYFYLEIKL